jgi:Arc/MetJ-type ribon-helix-helix transcriptional regulator
MSSYGMVKSTVRFPESVVGEIEALVEEGRFESKSEFYRFSTDYVLKQVLDDYDPETIDYEEIKAEVMPETEHELVTDAETDGPPFLESVSFVRKLALRGKFDDAEDFIDHQYAAGDRHAILLEELLRLYRLETGTDPGADGRPSRTERDSQQSERRQ